MLHALLRLHSASYDSAYHQLLHYRSTQRPGLSPIASQFLQLISHPSRASSAAHLHGAGRGPRSTTGPAVPCKPCILGCRDQPFSEFDLSTGASYIKTPPHTGHSFRSTYPPRLPMIPSPLVLFAGPSYCSYTPYSVSSPPAPLSHSLDSSSFCSLHHQICSPRFAAS